MSRHAPTRHWQTERDSAIFSLPVLASSPQARPTQVPCVRLMSPSAQSPISPLWDQLQRQTRLRHQRPDGKTSACRPPPLRSPPANPCTVAAFRDHAHPPIAQGHYSLRQQGLTGHGTGASKVGWQNRFRFRTLRDVPDGIGRDAVAHEPSWRVFQPSTNNVTGVNPVTRAPAITGCQAVIARSAMMSQI